ncbi:hypothetical protein CALCODRAFT_479084 [Calocera cornea HHB12733]|uniref:Uncharacterized protein n=1 Tax=Calocera cornea HHB12733 TaxID=1353952 RepID=A0A165K006_9BASI|nr:hypothetical protein CALCODRAFT_479084 [Calocera cornea HHB12733]
MLAAGLGHPFSLWHMCVESVNQPVARSAAHTTQRGCAGTPAVSQARKPAKRSIELARELMERGAPKIEGDIATLSQSALVAWIRTIKQETESGMPPMKGQSTRAQ